MSVRHSCAYADGAGRLFFSSGVLAVLSDHPDKLVFADVQAYGSLRNGKSLFFPELIYGIEGVRDGIGAPPQMYASGTRGRYSFRLTLPDVFALHLRYIG